VLDLLRRNKTETEPVGGRPALAYAPDEEDGPQLPRKSVWVKAADLGKKLIEKNEKELKKLRPLVQAVNAIDLTAETEAQLRQRSERLRERVRSEVERRVERFLTAADEGETPKGEDYDKAVRRAEDAVLDEVLPEAFALVREVAYRTIQLRPYDVQVIGGIVLHQGKIAEMKTGEGKTLSATMPIYLNALTGRGCHVITVNDYLAERDANWMRPVFEFLGLTVGFIVNDMTPEQRRAAYNCDVLYATNSEVGFDYLRDNMAPNKEDLVQRPLNYAIVDEVDNTLIDEARTPLIISAQVELSDRARRKREIAKVCDRVVRKLLPAVTEQELKDLVDEYTKGSNIAVDTLTEKLFASGAFEKAIDYLVESYVGQADSPRTENLGRLLNMADELLEAELVTDEGWRALASLAEGAPDAASLRTLVETEARNVLAPFSRTIAQAAEYLGRVEADELDAGEGLLTLLRASGCSQPELVERVALALQNGEWGERMLGLVASELVGVMQDRWIVDEAAGDRISSDVMAAVDTEQTDELLQREALTGKGALASALVMIDELEEWQQSVESETGLERTIEDARRTFEVVREISAGEFLAAEAADRLWETIQLALPRAGLKEAVVRALTEHPAARLREIADLVVEHLQSRKAYLGDGAKSLEAALRPVQTVTKPAATALCTRARQGAKPQELQDALTAELLRVSPNSDCLAEAAKYGAEQNKQCDLAAQRLAKELEEVIELPRDKKKVLPALVRQGGVVERLRDRVLDSVRDLPGESSEVPGMVTEAVNAVVHWREVNTDSFIDRLVALAPLAPESVQRLLADLSEGLPTEVLVKAVSEELLRLEGNAVAVRALEEHLEAREVREREQRDRLAEAVLAWSLFPEDSLPKIIELVFDAENDKVLYQEFVVLLASELADKHLEPTLAAEYAGPLADEIGRRMVLSKELANKLSGDEFTGKTKEQIKRLIYQKARASLPTLELKDFQRALKLLGWYSEKDEKQRASSLTETGNLLAEQLFSAPNIPDPGGFGERLVEAGVISEEDHAAVTAALQTDTHKGREFSAVLQDLRSLDPPTRRRVAELKLQEASSEMEQAVKAHALFHRDVHYVVQRGEEIVIVDEFTGRLQPGRRYSDGLHEALEAKHGVEVRLESQTVATITIQNYFRLYYKLAGMTGTAKTEEGEFIKVYSLEVLSIPTNRPVVRHDFPDIVFKTEEAKFRAIAGEILQFYWKQQPVLVGTRSVEVSERLSERLKSHNIQALALIQLLKAKLWDLSEKKDLSDKDRDARLAALNAPLPQLNMGFLRAQAKELGIPNDVSVKENLTRLGELLDNVSDDHQLLADTLKRGVPHNVLNAKNHKGEARIIAEAARPGAVTIATNMAGRGVDIVLGGTLDDEAKLRAVVRQIIVKLAAGDRVHVRSRTDQTTERLVEHLKPHLLQNLCWVTVVERETQTLVRQKRLDTYKGKALLDTLASPLSHGDIRTRVRSAAKKAEAADDLPLDEDVLQPRALARVARELGVQEGEQSLLARLLGDGLSFYVQRIDPRRDLLLRALMRLAHEEGERARELIETLGALPDLDEALLKTAAEAPDAALVPATLAQAAQALAPRAGLTEQWAADRLSAFGLDSAAAAQAFFDRRKSSEEAEFSDQQIVAALTADGEAGIDRDWVDGYLRSLGLVRAERRYSAPEAGGQAICHYRVDLARLREVTRAAASSQPAPYVTCEQILERIRESDARADWVSTDWVETSLYDYGIVRSKQDLKEHVVVGGPDGEERREETLHRIRLENIVPFFHQNLMGILFRHAQEAERISASGEEVLAEIVRQVPELAGLLTGRWLSEALKVVNIRGNPALAEDLSASLQVRAADLPELLLESGVAGQEGDHVVVGGVRSEDVVASADQQMVKRLGGLHILGTERHESRRIDNQLRGRSGRQGDPGESRFYLSLEDELMRLFGARPKFLMDRWPEDEPVEARIVTKSIERAQKKVELNNFEMRKNVLQYDDVMNIQREVIYGERRKALTGENIRDTIEDMQEKTVEAYIDRYCPAALERNDWEIERLYHALKHLFGVSSFDDYVARDELPNHGRADLRDLLLDAFRRAYADREERLTPDLMRELERWRVCEAIDDHWMQHLAEMDYLREGIGLRAYGQREPLLEYKREAFEMFQSLLDAIRTDVAEFLMSVPPEFAETVIWQRRQQRVRAIQMRRVMLVDEPDAPEAAAVPQVETFQRALDKVGRNDPCPCGSGRKYKRCCYATEHAV